MREAKIVWITDLADSSPSCPCSGYLCSFLKANCSASLHFTFLFNLHKLLCMLSKQTGNRAMFLSHFLAFSSSRNVNTTFSLPETNERSIFYLCFRICPLHFNFRPQSSPLENLTAPCYVLFFSFQNTWQSMTCFKSHVPNEIFQKHCGSPRISCSLCAALFIIITLVRSL